MRFFKKKDPKLTKTKNFPIFNVFMHFRQTSIDFVDRNALKGEQGKDWLSSSLL